MSAAQSCFLIVASPLAGHEQAIMALGGKRLVQNADESQPGGLPELWFSDHALFLVSPGRTGDANAPTWDAMLETLKRRRGVPSVCAIIVCVNVVELGASAIETAEKIRRQLDDMDACFGRLPVHVLVTGVEVLPGFAAYFAGLDHAGRQAAWGVPLSRMGDRARPDVLEAAFDRLAGQLVDDMIDSLRATAGEKATILAFPRHFTALKQPLVDFLKKLAPSRSETVPDFHFASLGEAGAGGEFFLKGFFEGTLAEAKPHQEKLPVAKTWIRGCGVAAIMLLAAGLTGLWGFSFFDNRSLVAATRSAIELDRRHIEEVIGQTAISEADLENVVDALSALRDLSGGFQNNDPSLFDRLGLGQRGKIAAAGEVAYRNALERVFRSRLMLEVEDIVRDNMASPSELYLPLKVYLMLGGQAPRVDAELVVAFLRRDWETRLYPGGSNRAGRDELETHLRAMLSPGEGNDGDSYLDRQLVEAAQRSLARMDLQEFAWASINSASYSSGLKDFSVAAAIGPPSDIVLDTLDGRGLAALSVPSIYTKAGFRDLFLKELSTIAQKIISDQWLMGEGGLGVGVTVQLERLGPRLLERYGREFATAWNGVLDNLKLRPLTEDREKFAALAALSSSASPLRKLVETITAETALTSLSDAEQRLSSQQMEEYLQGLKRVGIQSGYGKSHIRAGEAFGNASGHIPGAAIEEQFRPYRSLVHGDAGRRPIDALVQSFADIHQSLILVAGTSEQESGASANLQLQVHNLRTNASRLPRELARMVNAAVDDFDNDVSDISVAQLNNVLTGSIGKLCEEVTQDAYPFIRGSERDASIQDFMRLFAPGGEIDRFFAQNLAPMVDISVKPWRWRSGSGIADRLSASTLMQFQRAAEIRDAFFRNGVSTPEVVMEIAPFSLHGGADMAMLDIDGQIVQSRGTGGSTTEISWPDTFAAGAAALSILPALPGRTSAIRFEGPWSLMRLMDAATITSRQDGLQARFVLSGREVTYSIRIEAKENPFTLPALDEFRCPKRL